MDPFESEQVQNTQDGPCREDMILGGSNEMLSFQSDERIEKVPEKGGRVDFSRQNSSWILIHVNKESCG